MTEHRIKLGRTGLDVSPICFGTWQLSPRFWGSVPEADMIDAMHAAFECGVNFFDTADAYGEGLSESVVGQAIASLPRNQIVIATKVFHHFYDDGSRHGDLSRDYIISACEASLKRLGTDYIDLYQCHSFDPLSHPDNIADAMATLMRQGKIRHFGTSNWSVEQMRMGDKFGNFATCQPRYSLLARDIERDILPYCLSGDTGVLVYSPLHNGILAGKYTGDETFDDFRKNKAEYQSERFKTICGRVAEAGEIGKAYDLSIVQLILTVTLMHPAINCAIVGIKRREQIEQAAVAMGKTISRPDWYKVRELLAV